MKSSSSIPFVCREHDCQVNTRQYVGMLKSPFFVSFECLEGAFLIRLFSARAVTVNILLSGSLSHSPHPSITGGGLHPDDSR